MPAAPSPVQFVTTKYVSGHCPVSAGGHIRSRWRTTDLEELAWLLPGEKVLQSSESLETAVANKQWNHSLGSVGPCCTECGLWTSSIGIPDITWELVRDAETQAPQTCWVRSCTSIRSPEIRFLCILAFAKPWKRRKFILSTLEFLAHLCRVLLPHFVLWAWDKGWLLFGWGLP